MQRVVTLMNMNVSPLDKLVKIESKLVEVCPLTDIHLVQPTAVQQGC